MDRRSRSITERDAIRAILITEESEVLLMRIQPPDSTENFWITPGGGLDPGESIEGGLRRELFEELGLETFEIGPLVWRRQHTFDWGERRIRQREQYHIVHVSRFDPVMSDPIESTWVNRFHWWPLVEMARTRERLTPLSLATIVDRYFREGPPPALPEWEVLVD